MPNWDDPRGPRHDPERWRRGPARDPPGPGGERRPFGEPRVVESWARDRYPPRYPQDPARHGRGYEDDAGSAGYGHRQPGRDQEPGGLGSDLSHGGEPYAYGGQEYGVESYRSHAGRSPGWGFEQDGERRRGFDFDDPGVGQSQAGYAAEARSHSEPDFDPDYLRWRDEQLRAHDRDYEAWRREQHQRYDEQYRQFRSERQRHFGQAFHEWRSQRSAIGGAPGVSGGSTGGHASADQAQATTGGGVQGHEDPLKTDEDRANDADGRRR